VPFLEAEAGRRIFDDRLDSAGYARSAERYGLRAGLELDLGEKFSGEISGGWIVEAPQDDRLAPIEGISAAAALSWSPVRGTSVSFDGDTTVETTTEPGRSGSIYYSARLGLEREVRANLTVSASAGLGYRDYAEAAGEDLILDLGAGLTWWLNRHAGLTGRASYQTVTSTLPGRDTETATLFLGMKLRR
jgi:hypothetical protein